MNREQKTAKVKSLVEMMKASGAMLVADYRGLTVAESRELRNGLRDAGCSSFEVVKNTLTERAADEAGMAGLKAYLSGPTAIAFCGEDAAGPAKVLVKYAKEFKPLEIKGGLLEGQLIDTERIKYLASLPSKEVLMSQMLGAFQSPARGMVTVLSGTLRGLVTVLSKVQEQKASEAA